MLKRVDLVFVGVIQDQQFDWWPAFQGTMQFANPEEAKHWQVLRRRVRVETVLKGSEPRPALDIFEIFSVGAADGDWNLTDVGERHLFLVRRESRLYHVVRDWRRSVFRMGNGPHPRLPLDESHSFWERVALMEWWVPRNDADARMGTPNDPGRALSQWRILKLERGLKRHPSQSVRLTACRLLLGEGWNQDECWDALSDSEKAHLSDRGYRCCSEAEIVTARRKIKERGAHWWWRNYPDRELRRLITTASVQSVREEGCRLWKREYPDDHDNGCPPNRPLPATIVTEKGDVPLIY